MCASSITSKPICLSPIKVSISALLNNDSGEIYRIDVFLFFIFSNICSFSIGVYSEFIVAAQLVNGFILLT